MILLGGCQSVQDVSLKKLSDNTYQVTAADETDQLANGNALAMASQFCQRLGAQSQTVSGNALVEQGDTIEIDIPNRSIRLAVPDEVLAKRRAAMEARGAKAWRPAEARKRNVSTALRAYAAFATSAARGAVRQVP